MVIVPCVSAEEQKQMSEVTQKNTSVFTFSEKTDIVAYAFNPDNRDSQNLIDNYQDLNIPKRVTKFDFAQFKNIPLTTTGENRIPVTVYDKPYTLNLKRMNFENIDDGIDSYSGKIEGIENSLALFTIGGNVVQGYIEIGEEKITIVPVEKRADTEKSDSPLHIVYNAKDVITSEKGVPIDHGPAPLPPGIQLSDLTSGIKPNTKIATKGYAIVDILIGTDNEFFTQESNWVSSANQIMSMVSYQYDRSDIQVIFNVVSYDSSKKDQLSNNASITTMPLQVFQDAFSVSYLESNNADIALYLGGNDYKGTDTGTQGASWGYSYYPNYICRYAWSQMVEDTDDGLPVHVYDGSLFARECCVIHELGHIFNAGHQDSSGTNKATFWLDPAPHFTVMWTDYFGPVLSSHEYSSPSYHGDADHNNAGAINAAKSNIASIT